VRVPEHRFGPELAHLHKTVRGCLTI
jgi:hypothetical protein